MAEAWNSQKQFCDVGDGTRMAYVEQVGSNADDAITFVLLHGQPTSSFLWRNVLPELTKYGRAIAPDLIGMGDSDKLDVSLGEDRYHYDKHLAFVETFLDECVEANQNVIPVLHDWGSAIGFAWASRNEEKLKGIVYMEALVRNQEFEELNPPEFQDIFVQIRTPGVGEELIMGEANFFIESLLPSAIMRNLTEAEMNEYRRPYPTPGEDRRVLVTRPRELPLSGVPADNAALVDEYSAWLAETDLPKLLIRAEPGSLIAEGGENLAYARTFSNQKEVVVPGIHFIQEDSPAEIATAIDEWTMETFLTAPGASGGPPANPGLSSALLVWLVVWWFL